MENEPRYVETIACIYTCENDRELLAAFAQSVIGKYIEMKENCLALNVYARNDIDKSEMSLGNLFVLAEENYSKLSIKTHEMIKYCTSQYRFRRLIKIDVAVARTDFSRPEYAGRMPYDLHKMIDFIDRSQLDSDYEGFVAYLNATRENVELWAQKKGAKVDFARVFGAGVLPPFFNGSCYILSERFARYVAGNGSQWANELADYLNGAEDVLIGRLFQAISSLIRRGCV
jgi:hypothetical protein